MDGQEVDQGTSSKVSIEPMIEALLALPQGSVAVCAGHSGTLTAIKAGLGVEVDPACDFPLDNCVTGTARADFPGGYDNLWVVILGVPAQGQDDPTAGDGQRPRASLVNLRFGDPDP